MKWIAPHGAVTADERYRNAEPNIAGSNPDAAFFNDVLDELLAVITTADLNPSDENMHQIADAIVYLTERAATSGVTKGSFWFGKTTANSTVPAPTAIGQTYIDFTTLNTYISNDGSTWTQSGTFVKPEGIDFTILITSKFWDITEQTGQQGGEAKYNHTDEVWAYWPKIISFNNAALTGSTTAERLTMLAQTPSGIEGGEIEFESAQGEPNAGKRMLIDRYNGAIRIVGVDSSDNAQELMALNVQDKQITFFGKTMKIWVTDFWNSGNNWYIKYSNGYIEQGGRIHGSNPWVNFNVAMNIFNVRVSCIDQYAGERQITVKDGDWSTTGFRIYNRATSQYHYWIAHGWAI